MSRITLEEMPLVESEEQKRHLIRYVNFINSRPERDLKQKGFETHHIYPRSLAKKNNIKNYDGNWNLIELTPREHFIAHMILFYCKYKEMITAFNRMIHDGKHDENVTCKQYEKFKKDFSISRSIQYSGEGHPSWGMKRTEEQKRRMRKKHGGNAGHNKGKTMSEEQRRKLSLKNKGHRDSEETKIKKSNSHKGKKQSRESIEKGAAKRRGFKHSDESKKKMSIARKNRITTDETRKKMSESHKGKTFKWSDEAKANMSKLKKGCLENTVWYNNGVENIRLNQDDKVPNGFCKGKLQNGYKQGKKLTEEHKKKLGKSSEGKTWYTNGFENIRLLPNEEIPTGFSKGKTHNKEKKKGITDGFKNKFIPVSKEIPDGWFLGSTQNQESRKGKVIHITNGEIQKTVNIDYVIPDGWHKGRPKKYTNKSNTGKICITNNIDNKMINETEEIPEGWVRGRTIQRSKTI